MGLKASEEPWVGVAQFRVNGPENLKYLGGAAQDAIIGSLLQKGYQARALRKTLDPDRFSSIKQGDKKAAVVVAGRINVVGQSYRLRLKWVDQTGKSREEYLQVSHLNDLLPKLERFAAEQIQLPPVAVVRIEEPARVEPKKEEEKKAAPKVEKVEPVSQPVVEAPQVTPSDLPPSEKPSPKQEVVQETPTKTDLPPVQRESARKVSQPAKEPATPKYIRGYDFISPRLPFEVRGLAYGDVDGDGKREVLFTAQRKLLVYQFQGENLELLAEYPGKKLDYFVKVDLLPSESGGGSLIALTNLRGNRVSSKILKYSQGSIAPLLEDIPFQLRVVERKGRWELLGSPYYAGTPARHNIFLLSFSGNQVKAVKKLPLPSQVNLYDFNWVRESGEKQPSLVALTPSGKLRYYKMEGKKYKKIWSSRSKYGGSGNYIPVEVKGFFNEVVADYYALPPGILALTGGDSPEVVLAKNDSVVKNIIGRVPVIGDGRLYRLKYDELGFVETWESKKIDGSIQDYLITTNDGRSQLLAAVRLRKPGLLGDTGPNDSVLLIYNLN